LTNLLLIQVASTWAMTGIIWLVQLVQYVSFSHVGRETFQHFHTHHSRAITVIVAPLMIAEALSAVAFLWVPLRVQSSWEIWLGIGLVAIIWASTFLLQVPMHSRLARGFDQKSWRLLVRSNWVRTIAWSARAVLVSCWLHETLDLSGALGV
jgi:hypothetical protein